MKTRSFTTPLGSECLSLVILLAVWSVLALAYPAYILPSPWAVLIDLPAYLSPNFWHHAVATLYRTLAGFMMALGTGMLVGVIAYAWKKAQLMNSLMLALQVMPGTVLGVIFLLLFGAGNTAPILLVAFLTMPMLTINTVHGLSKRNQKLQEYLLSIHAGRLALFRYVDLPALIPVLRSNLSAGLGLAVKIVVLGEFIGAQDGIGFLLNQARLILDMKGVFFYLAFLLIFTLTFQAMHTVVFEHFFQKYEYPE